MLDMTRSIKYHFAHQAIAGGCHHFALSATLGARDSITPGEFNVAMKVHTRANLANHVVPLRPSCVSAPSSTSSTLVVPAVSDTTTVPSLRCPLTPSTPCSCTLKRCCRAPRLLDCLLSTPPTPPCALPAARRTARARMRFNLCDTAYIYQDENDLVPSLCENCGIDVAHSGCSRCGLCMACGECPCWDEELKRVDTGSATASSLEDSVRRQRAISEYFAGILSSIQSVRFQDKRTARMLNTDIDVATATPPSTSRQRRRDEKKRVNAVLLEAQGEEFS